MSVHNPVAQPENKQASSAANEEYQALKRYYGYIAVLFGIREMLVSDMATSLPENAFQKRLSDIAVMTRKIYTTTNTDQLKLMIDSVQALVKEHGTQNWHSGEAENFREMKRVYGHIKCVPSDLYLETIRLANDGKRAHAEAMREGDWGKAETYLQNVLDTYKKVAEYKQKEFVTETLYDSLLLGYANGVTEKKLDSLYSGFRTITSEGLQDLSEGDPLQDNPKEPDVQLSEIQVMGIGNSLLEKMGFEFKRGGLFSTLHKPLCNGTWEDVRIVIRSPEKVGLRESLTDILYQGAKGLYRQGLPSEFKDQPAGTENGLTVVTAICNLYNNLLRRSESFTGMMLGGLGKYSNLLTRAGYTHSLLCSDRNFQSRNVLKRTDANQAMKLCHDIIRFDIEKDLFRGNLEIKDLKERWDKECLRYFGRVPAFPEESFLQNPDWFTGRYGYIATHPLAEIMTLQIHAAIKTAHPDFEDRIASGDMVFIHHWLRKNIYSHGRRYLPLDLLETATGQPANPAYIEKILRKG